MKLISLKLLRVTIVATVIVGAYSCNDNTAQQTENNKKNDSIIYKDNAANATNTNISSTSNSANSSNSGIQHTWSVIIKPSTTKGYLDSITTAWEKENIVLTISKLKYDANNNLVKIKGSVSINTPKGNNASGEFKSENLTSIQIKVDDSPNVIIKGN